MKKALNISLTLFLIGIFFLIIPLITSAQKLPNIQEKSLRAPAAIKIDGKRTEWDNLIQASNKATGISYTICNDDDKLYLVVLAADQDIANKIINAGLTFTISVSGKVKNEGGMAITFPFLYKEDNRKNLPLMDYDNEVSVWNQQLTAKTKDIRVAGMKGVKDTISIYNQEGIKVAALFGKDSVFTYELAIPLKYLGLSVKEPKPFAYNIKLNGSANYPYKLMDYSEVLTKEGAVVQVPNYTPKELRLAERNQSEAIEHVRPYLRRGGGIKGMHFEGGHYILGGPNGGIVMGLISPTYFSGEYKLAK